MPSLTNTQSQPVARPLNRQDYKTLGLSSLGGTLEFYDFVIFIFYAKTISLLFFPAGNQFLALIATLGLFAADYLARPLGGIIMAHYGDKIGRKRMFSLSIFMMALPTLVIGALPTYSTIGIAAPLLLLLMRIMQGAAIGGEMPGAWVFIAEHMPKQRYGLAIGTLTSGITGGILLGSIIAITIEYHFTEQQIVDFAWRIPFIVGGLFGFIAVYLRRFLQETPIFKELAAQRALCNELPVKTVLTSHKQACLITALLTWSLSTSIIVIILMTPDVILRGIYHIERNSALQANCFAVLMLTVGCIFWGYLSDKIGSRLTMLVAYSGLIISASYFYSILSPAISFLTLSSYYGIMGLFVGAVVLTPIIGTRAFPPAIRFSGLSFAYNIAYAIFGGLTPIITGFWLQQSHLAPVYYVSAVAVLAILVGFLPLAYQGWQHQRAK